MTYKCTRIIVHNSVCGHKFVRVYSKFRNTARLFVCLLAPLLSVRQAPIEISYAPIISINYLTLVYSDQVIFHKVESREEA